MANFTKEEAKREITKLVEDFDNKINIIKKGDSYKEANVEDEFIKPLFKYLNWNISNEGIKNIADREFIVQAKGKGGKEPDYLLQLEGKPYFYIEAKHPKYDLFKEIKYIWQAYSYAYSTQSSSDRKKVDFSLLTDFEEFRLFDCTFKADPNTVNNFNVVDWKYTDYVDKFDLLWQYFEKENVRKGSLKSLYINEKQIKENRIPPDKAFLDDLDNEKTGWRIILAKDIKKYNPELSSDFITSVIQLIIDRLVFIKVLSDREIEDDFLAQVIEQINKASSKSDEGIINDICKDLFTRMNKTYNGSIFEERKELDIVKLSNKTLHSILKSLLPENSRYNFKVIPVAILGTIYEQFLGKIVTTTDKRATIDYKPEFRKAHGVYYTPQYIVEYIVENTIGTKLSKCKSINDVMNIKICDPACGSGSFLLGAYDKLITHIVQYFTDKVNHKKEITKKERELFYQDNDGNIRLTAKIKRNILNNCIFGVDIDQQAVEVTKMSLSLKALEDTKHDELYNEVDLFNEKVLPDLTDNIKCGNSLIESDFYKDKDSSLFGNDEMKKINVFDWKKEFPEIFKNGGFDCVIGNPPWGSKEVLESEILPYLDKKYKRGIHNLNIFALFIDLSVNILNNKGFLGFLIPKNFIKTEAYKQYRIDLLNNNTIKLISDFGKFPGVAQECIGLFVLKEKIKSNMIDRIILNANNINYLEPLDINIVLNDNFKVITLSKLIGFTSVLPKIEINSFLLKNEFEVFRGMEHGRNGDLLKCPKCNKHFEKPGKTNKDLEKIKCKFCKNEIHVNEKNIYKFIKTNKENSNYFPLLIGSSIDRYKLKEINYYIEVDLTGIDYKELNLIEEKILFIRISKDFRGYYDNEKMICLNALNIIIKKKKSKYDIKYILGILNSKLYKNYADFKITSGAELTIRLSNEIMRNIPIKSIDFSNPSDKQTHDHLVSLVDQMLDAQKEFHTKKDTADEHTSKIMKQRIDNIDNQIDEVVYKLYNLTEDEIKIVEGN